VTKKQKNEKVWFINGKVPGFDLATLPRCKAIAKSTGKQCKNPRMRNSDFCCVHDPRHDFKPGARLGNKNALKHGLYSREFKDQVNQVKGLVDDLDKLLKGASVHV
jgi:hypothetical protein